LYLLLLLHHHYLLDPLVQLIQWVLVVLPHQVVRSIPESLEDLELHQHPFGLEPLLLQWGLLDLEDLSRQAGLQGPGYPNQLLKLLLVYSFPP
jgi:hypothetical protein